MRKMTVFSRTRGALVILLALGLMVTMVGCAQADGEDLQKRVASLQRQVELLERAFAPTSSQEAAEKWAAAVQARNGAAQFAVLAPELRTQTRSLFEALMWVTGTSSPWVEDYQIAGQRPLSGTKVQFEVRFRLATSTGPAGEYVVELIVVQEGDGFYIAAISSEIDGLFPQ